MTLWFPETDLFFHDVQATRVGRFKMWIHFTLFHNWVYPHLPQGKRKPFYEIIRRWVFGPNANNEDLRTLLADCRASLEAG